MPLTKTLICSTLIQGISWLLMSLQGGISNWSSLQDVNVTQRKTRNLHNRKPVWFVNEDRYYSKKHLRNAKMFFYDMCARFILRHETWVTWKHFLHVEVIGFIVLKLLWSVAYGIDCNHSNKSFSLNVCDSSWTIFLNIAVNKYYTDSSKFTFYLNLSVVISSTLRFSFCLSKCICLLYEYDLLPPLSLLNLLYIVCAYGLGMG